MNRELKPVGLFVVLCLLCFLFMFHMERITLDAARKEHDACNQALRYTPIREIVARCSDFKNQIEIQNCEARALTDELIWANHAIQEEQTYEEMCGKPYVKRLCESWWTMDICRRIRSR